MREKRVKYIMKQIVIYDNTIRPNEIIKEVIAEKGFGDIVVRRKKVKKYYQEEIEKIFPETAWYELESLYDVEKISNSIEKEKKKEKDDVKIIHCFSDYIISKQDMVSFTLKKLPYIEESIVLIQENKCPAIMFHTVDDYLEFLEKVLEAYNVKKVLSELKYAQLEVEGYLYIGEIGNFIQCITGNFDSRYFNSLQGTQYVIKKSSKNKTKIKSEYQYYHLLPEHMQRWFVLPFNYREDEATASYEMERLHMTDVAIKWVHGSIGIPEFSDLMDMYFRFFDERTVKEIPKEEYESINKALYLDKVEMRITELKNCSQYAKIANLLSNCEEIGSIDALYERYRKLKQKIESKVVFTYKSVIGHGDPCFANAMYNRSTRTLKFIDPKGALTEQELWTNPYYDIAKLSHSICGRYDFFNNAMFDIAIDENFNYQLDISFDNKEYKRLFKEKVEENGYSYWAVRVYEVSLFLSMLSLHIDYPHKVFGFILNAHEIMKEIEENV